MKLRNYQQAAVDAVIESWKKSRSCLIVLPTGCGKTVVFGEVIRRRLMGGEEERSRGEVKVEGERSRGEGERSRGEVKVNGGLATLSLHNAASSDAERIPRLRLVGGDPRYPPSRRRAAEGSGYSGAPRNPDSTNAAFGGDCGAFGERPLPAQQTRLRGPLPTNNLTTNNPQLSTLNSQLSTQQPNKLTTQQPNNPTPTGQHDKGASVDRSSTHDCDSNRAMVLAHREELISQAEEKVAAITALPVGVEMGPRQTDELPGMKPPVVVSSVQTQITGRMNKFDPGEFNTLVIDEAHHATSKSYRLCIEHYLENSCCRLLGVTATPDRADETALGIIFDTVAYEYSVDQAIRDGWLVPVRQKLVSISSLDFSQVSTCAGDFNQGELSEILEEEQNLHGIASPTIEICGNRRAIVFATSVRQAERLAEIINRYAAEGEGEGERSRGEVKVEGERSRGEVKVNNGLAPAALHNAAFSDAERIPRLQPVGGDPRAPRNPDSTNAAFGGDCGAFGERPLPAGQHNKSDSVDRCQPNNLTTQQPNNLTTQHPNNLTTQHPNNLTTQHPNNLTTQHPNNPTPQHPSCGRAAWICGKTPKEDRKAILQDFRNGKLQYIVNVGVLTEGFDDAGVEVVVMARPTKSRALYAQMAGRATRPAAEIAAKLGELEDHPDMVGADPRAARRDLIAHSSKPSCLIVDFVGNSGRHKLVTALDILGGKELDPDEEEAQAIVKKRCEVSEDGLDTLEELEKARKEIKRRKEEEVKRRAFIKLTAKYSVVSIDPFNVYDLAPMNPAERSALDQRHLSFKQRQVIRERIGIDPNTVRSSEGKALLDAYFGRRERGLATLRQTKYLRRKGILMPMTFEEASATISRLVGR